MPGRVFRSSRSASRPPRPDLDLWITESWSQLVATLLVSLQELIGPLARLLYSTGLRLMFFCIPLLGGCADEGTSSQFNDVAMAMAKASHGRQNLFGSTITYSPTSFAFSVTQSDTNPVHMVSISNSGRGTLNWSVSTSASWITLSPSTGTASGNTSDQITATADLTGLVPGTYTASINVFGVGATNNGESISVTLTISPAISSTESLPTTTSLSNTTTSATSITTPSAITPTMATASLSWSPETDPTVLGYYVHYGTESPNSVGSCAYAQSVYYSLAALDNTSLPSATMINLISGTTYFFAVSAFNGTESLCSNEVSKAT